MKLRKFKAHEVNDQTILVGIELAIEGLSSRDENVTIIGNKLIYVKRNPCGDIDVLVSTITHQSTLATSESDES